MGNVERPTSTNDLDDVEEAPESSAHDAEQASSAAESGANATDAGEEVRDGRNGEPFATDEAPPEGPSSIHEDLDQDVEGMDEVLFAEVDEAPTPSLEDVLRLRIGELEDELRATQQRLLRIAADHENFKRRTEREKDEMRKFGNEKVLVDLLPVMDNFERALSHGTQSQERESLLQGVEMVRRQFETVLRKYGCAGFESVGTPFDPQRHEAVHQVESHEHDPNTVIEEYHRGYFLQDRLIRPALVAVSKLPATPAPVEPTPPAEAEQEPAAQPADAPESTATAAPPADPAPPVSEAPAQQPEADSDPPEDDADDEADVDAFFDT